MVSSLRTHQQLSKDIIRCARCPRLIAWCQEVAQSKKAAYKNETYWGKPVPSFGPLDAELLILGLAPAAHGANRTGRMFTGDRSGLWLYRALHKAGFANQFSYERADDGLQLLNTRISAMVHCAPPDNRPNKKEKEACFGHLERELTHMKQLKMVLALGGLAWDSALRYLRSLGDSSIRPKPKFGHAQLHKAKAFTLVGSYHPSQQNTFTRRLTEPMLDSVFEKIQKLLKT